MTYDAGDPQQVQEAKKAAKTRRARKREHLRYVLADERGRQYLAHVIRESEAMTAQVSPTAEGALFREGKRAPGLMILNDVLELLPEQFPALVTMTLRKPNEGETDGRRAEQQSAE